MIDIFELLLCTGLSLFEAVLHCQSSFHCSILPLLFVAPFLLVFGVTLSSTRTRGVPLVHLALYWCFAGVSLWIFHLSMILFLIKQRQRRKRTRLIAFMMAGAG